MLVSQDTQGGQNLIQAYEPGKIKIANVIYQENIIIDNHTIFKNKLPNHFSEITLEHLQFVIDHKPQVLLIGCGKSPLFLPEEYATKIMRKPIGLEVMTSQAACRTFNVLLSENRKVSLVLFI